jgi:butyrate kinase
LFQQNIIHKDTDLEIFDKVSDQYEFRKTAILDVLKKNEVDLECVEAVMGRGGLINPVPSGVIEVNEVLKKDLRNSPIGEHASNLGGLIADDIAKSLPNARAFIANPVVVDEFEDIARVAGHPFFERKSIYHALNQKAIAHDYARARSIPYEDLNLIVAHIGGGITVGAHKKGKVVDVNQGLDGEGPFSPERSGTLPIGQVITACYSGKYTEKEVRKMVTGKGGVVAYFQTNDIRKLKNMMDEGNAKAKLIFEAMAYQVSKDIGAMFTVLYGEVDAILITGGVAYCQKFTDLIGQRVSKLAPVHVYPGEDEMKALAKIGARVLMGELETITYS